MLWGVGFGARVSLLAIPPLIPAIHRELSLDETAVGALGGLPILLLSIGALVGSLVIARLGPRRAGVVGLAVVAAAGALRGVGPSITWLFAMTFVMAIGIALTQLAIPSLVAAWQAHNVGRATAAYGNGMLVGEIAGAGLTATVVLPLARSWEGALALWSIPVVLIGLALLRTREGARPAVAPAWWPRWRDARLWLVGLTFGSASLAYWGANAHLPDYLAATGHTGDVPLALGSLNALQLPSSLALAALPGLFLLRRWPFVASGVVTVGCAVGLVVMGGAASAVWSGALGFVSSLVFLLALAFAPALVPQDEVHSFSAGIFSISYFFAFAGALLAGALWDATGVPAMALVPTAIAGILMAFLGTRIHMGEAARR